MHKEGGEGGTLLANHKSCHLQNLRIAQGSLDRKSWQGGKDGRFAEVGSELAIWKAMRSFLFMFVLAFGKSVCVHVDKNSCGYDPVICATIYFGMLVVTYPKIFLREYSFSLVVLFSDHLSSPYCIFGKIETLLTNTRMNNQQDQKDNSQQSDELRRSCSR